MAKASGEAKAADDKRAQESLEFAKWWQDPSVPQEVKAYFIWSGRILALAERCPEIKPDESAIGAAATKAGISKADIRPGGRFFATMAMIMISMRQGTLKDSHEEACAAARKYRGD